MMITGAQITAARALLGWSLRVLARHASLNIADVQEAETSSAFAKRRLRDLPVIQEALQDAGITFIGSVGVQLFPRDLWRQMRRSRSVFLIAGRKFTHLVVRE